MRDDRLLAIVEGDDSRTHGERLPGEIESALKRAGVNREEVDLFAVASGPGAFTGLRIGLAAIQGLAMVLQKPVVGVSALEALAESAWTELGVPRESGVGAWMDAQRGEVFTAEYEFGEGIPRELVPPAVGLPEELIGRHADKMISFVGDGARKHASVIENAPHLDWRVVDRVAALAPAIGRIGRLMAARGQAGPPHALQPLYVRRPDAELDRERQPAVEPSKPAAPKR